MTPETDAETRRRADLLAPADTDDDHEHADHEHADHEHPEHTETEHTDNQHTDNDAPVALTFNRPAPAPAPTDEPDGSHNTPTAPPAASTPAEDDEPTSWPWPSLGPVLISQFRHHNRLFWRSPLMATATLALPLGLLALLRVIYADDLLLFLGNGFLSFAQFYAPAMAAFVAAQATYGALGVNLAQQRDQGVLKRIRATPVPVPIYLGGAVLSALWVAVIGSVLMFAVGVVVFDLEIDATNLPAIGLNYALGVTCFAALGLALASVSPGGNAAPAIANGTILPIAFISDVFIPLVDIPSWLDRLGDMLPLKPFAEGMRAAFDTRPDTELISLSRIGVLVVWTIIGLTIAKLFFRWER